MSKLINLDNHFSITSANKVNAIAAPLIKNFGIKHFRYLKLYQDKSRVLLSNHPDCTRFIYEDGTYQKMWFDGEFPEYLKGGCHLWDAQRGAEKTPFEHEINKILGLYHGITFVFPVDNYWEIFTFDAADLNIYHIDKRVFSHFMLYFKEQAVSLIRQGAAERLILPSQPAPITRYEHPNKHHLMEFLKSTRVKRYYLGGRYRDVYLTSKEAQCIYWLIEGKSADEIARIEGNSIKTINRHLENVRVKLNCYKQTQLVKIILEADIFDVFKFYKI